MSARYSKPSSDIALETEGWQARDAETLARQRMVAKHLTEAPRRDRCVLCGMSLDGGEGFGHRGVDYLACPRCSHVQTAAKVPQGYPHAVAGAGFESVYPRLEPDAYRSRRDRIYVPKLDWALAAMDDAGLPAEAALLKPWLEIGCGAGYFLDALRAAGADTFLGLDGNADLVSAACAAVGEGRARLASDILADVAASDAEIFVAWFVLEHLEDVARYWQVMSEKPAGTYCLIAVPAMGFATLLESAFDDFAARNLDSVLHTQLYTDQSLDFAFEMAGYEKVSEWLFGQDAIDLCRVLAARATGKMPVAVSKELRGRLISLADPVQAAIDRARLCDARHVLAVKR